tara:strand:- start:109124 stop:109453 length:330 start_codon:yes stop_codon:yes gene_type:complete
MSRRDDSSADTIRASAKRLQHARSKPGESPLLGFSVFGIVGWSIAVPTVAGALLGHWLDQVAPQKFSWTIALILGGVAIGGVIAVRWLNKVGVEQDTQSLEKQDNGEDQ